MNSTKSFFLFFTLVIFVCSSVFTQAQFKKGNWLAEGNIGYLSLSDNTSEYKQESSVSKYESSGFSFSVYPRAGYFLTNDLVLGTTIGFSFSSSKYESFDEDDNKNYDSESNNSYISLYPFLRYYLPSTSSAHLRFYGQVGGGINAYLSYGSESTDYDNNGNITSKSKTEYPEKYFSYTLEGLVGLNYFLAENVALNTSLGYSYRKSVETSKYTYTPTGGTPVVQPESEYTTKSGSFAWSIGFAMIIP